MNKIDETLPILWKQKHPSGRGKEQTKREDQHPTKRTSLKSANTRTKAANQPICSKVQQARASAITQGNYVHIFNRCSFTTLGKFFFFLFFWFNFVMYPNWWSTRTLAKCGYRPDMKVEKLMNPFMFWLPAGTCCKNLEV